MSYGSCYGRSAGRARILCMASAREGSCDQCLRARAARAHGPVKRLRVTGRAAGDVYGRDDLAALRILRPDDVNGRKQRRDHREQARVGDVPAWADPAPKAEARRTRVAHSTVERARWREIPLGLEGFGVGVVLGIMQDGPGVVSTRKLQPVAIRTIRSRGRSRPSG
jgi:hypothetical protein